MNARQHATVDPYLQPTPFIDCTHDAVRAFTAAHAAGSDDRERAVNLYYAVRDGLRYDAYCIDPTLAGLRASATLTLGYGWCVSKAVVLAACCRAAAIPARLGYADVRNHLSTKRLRKTMGTDLFIWHGYTDICLDEQWVKATPAFNIELCEKFRIQPLDFDGRADSIYHPYDLAGRQHMEYVRFRGDFTDVPLEEMLRDFATVYPNFSQGVGGADFAAEVDRETAPD